MEKRSKHPTKKWEISLIEVKNYKGKKFKVTRRIPSLSVSETKVFRSKNRAKKKLDEWLR